MAQPDGLRLVIVENDELLRTLMEEMVASLGHEVVGHANNAFAAVAEVEEKHPDTVLMDIKLDGAGDGIDAAFAIKNRMGIRSLFITATADRATRERSALADPIGFLEKPIGLNELAVALMRVDASSAPHVVTPRDHTQRQRVLQQQQQSEAHDAPEASAFGRDQKPSD